jgi:hypothetical protein
MQRVTSFEAYQAQLDRIAMSGDVEPDPGPNVIRLPEADADAVSPLYALCECQKWLVANGRKERERAFMLAQRLAALEAEVDDFLDEVDYIVPGPRAIDWDDETDWKEGRW